MNQTVKRSEYILKITITIIARLSLMSCVLLSACNKDTTVTVPIAVIDNDEFHNDRNIPNMERPIEKRENDREMIIGIWEYPGGEADPMQIIFHEDGSLEFKNGFEFYNPAEWNYETKTYELSLFLPKLDIEDMEAFLYRLEKKEIKKIDKIKKEIVYDLSLDSRAINFAGWIYRKK